MRISDWSSDVCSSDLDSSRIISPVVRAAIWGINGKYLRHPFEKKGARREPSAVTHVCGANGKCSSLHPHQPRSRGQGRMSFLAVSLWGAFMLGAIFYTQEARHPDTTPLTAYLAFAPKFTLIADDRHSAVDGQRVSRQ